MSRLKAKLVLKKMVENGGKKGEGKGHRASSMSAAMKEIGYSDAYAKNPQKFTSTKNFQELVQENLSDEMITERHKELANAAEISHYTFPHAQKKHQLTNEEVKAVVESVPGCKLIYVKRDIFGTNAFFSQPDQKSREKAIDMAYKLKGSYAPEQISLTKRKYADLSNEELIALKTKLKNALLKK